MFEKWFKKKEKPVLQLPEEWYLPKEDPYESNITKYNCFDFAKGDIVAPIENYIDLLPQELQQWVNEIKENESPRSLLLTVMEVTERLFIHGLYNIYIDNICQVNSRQEAYFDVPKNSMIIIAKLKEIPTNGNTPLT